MAQYQLSLIPRFTFIYASFEPTFKYIQDPPPWIPAEPQHTTPGTSDDAEMHMIRAVSTGIINVRLSCSSKLPC